MSHNEETINEVIPEKDMDKIKFPESFQNILSNSEYFTMWQHSDILTPHCYNQIVFLGDTKVNSDMEGDSNQFSDKNDYLDDYHTQLFILKEDYYKNQELEETSEKIGDKIVPVHSKKEYSYKIIDSTDDLFKGILSVGDYLILVNSSKTENHNVYVFNVNKYKNVEYLCFVKIGELINPGPYLPDEISEFERKYGFELGSKTRQYLLTHSKIYKYELNGVSQLFYINLYLEDEKISKKYHFGDNTRVSNQRNLLMMNRLLKNRDKTKEQIDAEYIELSKLDDDLIRNIDNGLLLLGRINSTGNKKEYLYLIVNRELGDGEETYGDLDGSLFVLTIERAGHPDLYQMQTKINLEKIGDLD
jgi:hypothetical protein